MSAVRACLAVALVGVAMVVTVTLNPPIDDQTARLAFIAGALGLAFTGAGIVGAVLALFRKGAR